MAEFVHRQWSVFFEHFSIGSDLMAVTLELEADEVDGTVFDGSNTHKRLEGALKDFRGSIEGLWRGGSNAPPDKPIFDRVGDNAPLNGHGNAGRTLILAQGDGGAGQYAYGMLAGFFGYTIEARIGEAFRFSSTFRSVAEDVGRGLSLGNVTGHTTGSLDADGQQVGALSATQTGLWLVSVQAITASDLDLTLRSAALDDMAGATSEETILNVDEVGGYYALIPGPVTNTFWDVTATATAGSATIASALVKLETP
jgi:hypothetical protein